MRTNKGFLIGIVIGFLSILTQNIYAQSQEQRFKPLYNEKGLDFIVALPEEGVPKIIVESNLHQLLNERRYDEFKQKVNDIIATHPEDPYVLIWAYDILGGGLGLSNLADKKLNFDKEVLQESIKYLEKAEELALQDKIKYRQNLAHIYLLLPRFHFLLGNYQEAKRICETIIAEYQNVGVGVAKNALAKGAVTRIAKIFQKTKEAPEVVDQYFTNLASTYQGTEVGLKALECLYGSKLRQGKYEDCMEILKKMEQEYPQAKKFVSRHSKLLR